jgi:hypothetical protein
MANAEHGFVVLVRIGQYRRGAYVVACEDRQTAEAEIRQRHASDSEAEYFVSSMPDDAMRSLAMASGEIKDWHARY